MFHSCNWTSTAILNKLSSQIGINYFAQDAELRGCINDARNMQKFLCSAQKKTTLSFIYSNLLITFQAYYNYKKDDIVMLTDDSTDPRMMPTRENIVRCS